MEEVEIKNESVAQYLERMYCKVDQGNPVIGWVDGVRIIMFKEEHVVDPHYDGPR